MSDDKIDIRYVAKLARIALTDEEIERFGAQLGDLLAHVNALAELDTDARARDRAGRRIAQRRARRRGPPVSRSRGRARAGAAAAGRVLPRSADHRGVGRMMEQLLDRNAAEIARAVNAGSISARRSRGGDARARRMPSTARVGAYLTVLPGRSRARCAPRVDDARSRGRAPAAGRRAARGERQHVLDRDTRTTCGSKILEHWIAPYTATAVARMLEAGAMPIGKTNLDEFAMGSSCENSALGVTRNPYDLSRVPGGSSGGSAAAVAAHEAAIGLGSDTGGSIREPGAFCNLVGFKPTYGRVSRYGLIAFASSLDQIGPLARTVEDAALAYDAMAGYDPMDATSIDRPVEPAAPALREDLAGLRIGIVREFDTEELGDELDALYRQRLRATSTELGAELVEVSLPTADYGLGDVLSDRAGGVFVEPGAIRRRALRTAGRGRRRAGDVRTHARRRLRSGGEAADPHRYARAFERLLRRLLRARAKSAHADRARFRDGLCGLRPDRVSGRQLRRPFSSTPRAIRTACT